MEPETSRQILAEVRSLKRLTKQTSIAALLLLVVFIIYAVWLLPPRDPYSVAARATRAGDYARAIEIVQRASTERPTDYYPHQYLGMLYLESGDLGKSEEEYSRAYALYPSDAISRSLSAVRERRSESSASASPVPTKP